MFLHIPSHHDDDDDYDDDDDRHRGSNSLSPDSMCSYRSRSFRMLIADSLAKNIWKTKSAVLRSIVMKGAVGSAALMVSMSRSKPAWTMFNGDLPT